MSWGRVREAYEFAAGWHEGQWRMSGDWYITHPLAAGEPSAAAGRDCTMVCAALLHDVWKSLPAPLNCCGLSSARKFRDRQQSRPQVATCGRSTRCPWWL
jgi:hypothetical protein